MIKKPTSMILIASMILGFMTIATAQDEKDYTMWETVLMTPDNTKLKVLAENMRKHNKKYHNEGPYNSAVYTINSGPNSGKIVWMMGPLKFSHNDSRPSSEDHDSSWQENVMPYIKKINTIEYWKQDDEFSNTSMLGTDPSVYPILFVSYAEIEDNKVNFVKSFYEKVSKTVKAMEGENPWGLYYNEFRQGDLGRHIASVSFFKNWADFDKDNKFKETYIKLNGENSWQPFLDLYESTFSNNWDEIWNYSKTMSGK